MVPAEQIGFAKLDRGCRWHGGESVVVTYEFKPRRSSAAVVIIYHRIQVNSVYYRQWYIGIYHDYCNRNIRVPGRIKRAIN